MKTLFLSLIVTLCVTTAVHAESWDEFNWESGVWSSSKLVNGVCGSANGSVLAFAPAEYLCSAGTASSVTGSDPWSWVCNGENGGTDAACSATFMLAPKAKTGTQGYTSIRTAYDAVISGAIVKLLGGTQTEIVTFDLNKSIFIDGGYNVAFSEVSTVTTIQGPLKIKAGTVRMKDIKVK